MTPVAARDLFRLDGSVAAVVGTSPNIGTGIALRLAEAGAKVACLDLDLEAAERAAGEIRDGGGQAVGLRCDVTSEAAVSAAFDAVEARFGLVDALVNAPVRYLEKGIREMTLAEWRAQLAVLLDGTFLTTKRVTSALLAARRPGSVTNLISTAGHQGEPNNVGYTTAKGGILNMTRSLAVELAPFGIRVNSLTPTATDPSEGIERGQRWGIEGVPEEFVKALKIAAAQTPLGVLPAPSDYGAAAVYLASPAARMITGTDLRVDSGSVAKYWRTKPDDGS